VDRRILIEAMRERGIGKELVERVEEVIRETKSNVRIVGEVRKGFWMAKKVKQGSPLSPMLFNLLIADLKEEIGKIR